MGINSNHPQTLSQQQQQQSSSASLISSHTNMNASHLHGTNQQPPISQPATSFRTSTPQMMSIATSTASLLAACQVTPGSEYILCKVLFHDTVRKTYKLADEDIESNKSTFLLLFSPVILVFLVELCC
jgi:hypothetical protein